MNIDRRKLAAALWYRELKATNNETFMPLFFDEHRFLVLRGGGSSGRAFSPAGRSWSG
jgi:phage terminase large subunit